MDYRTLEQKLLEWCREQKDFGLFDLRTYAWTIAGSQKNLNRLVDRFIKSHLEPI